MQENKNLVSDLDIKALLDSPLNAKVDVIKKIGKYYTAGSFDYDQKVSADKILSQLLKNSDLEVKITISESIKDSEEVSSEIVMELAEDEAHNVSVPVLEFSPVLSDEDLLYLIEKTEDEKKQQSISKRETVSDNVSSALVEKGNDSVVTTLLNNKGAAVTDKIYDKIISKFPDKATVLSAIKNRASAPDKIISTVKQKLMSLKLNKTDIEKDYNEFSKAIKKMGVQESVIPIYALCLGDIKLFEICLARFTGAPISNIRTLINDDKGFDKVYKRAQLPESLYHATDGLLFVLNSMGDELREVGVRLSAKEGSRIITNIMMYIEEVGEIENIEYIITLIRNGIENFAKK